MKILILICKIIIILIIIISCDAADQYLGVNNDFLDSNDDSNSNGGGGGEETANYYSNISEAMADGVIGYWKMDETSGNTSIDETGTQNGTSSNTTIIDGKNGFGKCRSYSGTNSWTNITGFTSATQSYTFGFWMYFNNTANCYYFDTQSGRFLLGVQTNTLRIYDGAWRDYTYGHSTGTWLYVVNVLNGAANTADLYINGIHQGIQVSWAGINIGGTTRIASRYPGASQWYNGYLDDLAIWNRALSASEISNIYNSNAPLTP
jgi:hypothetical protein